MQKQKQIADHLIKLPYHCKLRSWLTVQLYESDNMRKIYMPAYTNEPIKITNRFQINKYAVKKFHLGKTWLLSFWALDSSLEFTGSHNKTIKQNTCIFQKNIYILNRGISHISQ